MFSHYSAFQRKLSKLLLTICHPAFLSESFKRHLDVGKTALSHCNSVFLKHHVCYNISVKLFVVGAFWIRRSPTSETHFAEAKKKPEPCDESTCTRFNYHVVWKAVSWVCPDLGKKIFWSRRLESSLLNKFLIIQTQLRSCIIRKGFFGPSLSLRAAPTPLLIMLTTLSPLLRWVPEGSRFTFLFIADPPGFGIELMNWMNDSYIL